MSTVDNLMNTSVEDCKQLLTYQTDIAALQELHTRCVDAGHKTRAKLVESRIRKLEKGNA